MPIEVASASIVYIWTRLKWRIVPSKTSFSQKRPSCHRKTLILQQNKNKQMAENQKRKKLCEVTIKGYKSIAFENPITLHLGDVNILLGANGAGKSNIISFFYSS